MASDGGNNLGRENRVNAVSTAGVAELADAPDSKSGGGNPMRVRFPPSALVVMDPITFRRRRDLTYHDPAEKLQEYVATLREVEAAIAGQEVAPDAVDVFALRTNELNRFRELRDGALFGYGMGLAFGMKIGIAADEDVDHDCITAWVEVRLPADSTPDVLVKS